MIDIVVKFHRSQELWNQYGNDETDEVALFSNQGIKHEVCDGSFLHTKQLEFVQNQYGKKLQKEKIEKL